MAHMPTFDQPGDGTTIVVATVDDETITGAGTALDPLVARGPYIDLRIGAYAVTVNDASAAAANTAAINAAITAFSGTGATLALPTGTVYLEQANPGSGAAQRAWSIRFGLGVSRLALVGQGPHTTRLIQAGAGNAGSWDCISIDGATRIAIADLSVEQGTITSPSPGDQNHLIGVYAGQNANTSDITISDVYFGPCIGDGLRVVGDGAGVGQEYVERLRLVNFTMRTGGHPQGANGLGLGSRSGVSLQRGWRDLEIGNGFIHGAKNSPFEMEPTGTNICHNLIAHDLIIDNQGGQTYLGMTVAGGATSPLRRCTFANLTVLQGGVLMANTYETSVTNVTVYASGLGPMAGNSATLLDIVNAHEDLNVINCNLVRDTGSTGGMLCQVVPLSSGYPRRVTIRGGAWRSEVDSGLEAAYLYCWGPSQTVIDGVSLKLAATVVNEFAVKFRPNGEDMEGVTVRNVTATSGTTKLAAVVYVAATDSLAISNVAITGVRAPDFCTYGVLFDVTTGTSVDAAPILQGCDFKGATAGWLAQNSAVGVVHPIVAGNKGSTALRWQVGTVAPESVVTAPQGSRYTRQNGDSTTEWFKATGVSNTGWTQVSIP